MNVVMIADGMQNGKDRDLPLEEWILVLWLLKW